MLTDTRPQTYPCFDCKTTRGGMTEGDVLPRRRRGLCDTCYTHHFRAGTLARYPEVTRYYGRRGRYTTSPREVRRRNIAIIAARVAAREGVPVVEGDWDAAAVIAATERAAAAWLRAHPNQTAHLDAPHRAA